MYMSLWYFDHLHYIFLCFNCTLLFLFCIHNCNDKEMSVLHKGLLVFTFYNVARQLTTLNFNRQKLQLHVLVVFLCAFVYYLYLDLLLPFYIHHYNDKEMSIMHKGLVVFTFTKQGNHIASYTLLVLQTRISICI